MGMERSGSSEIQKVEGEFRAYYHLDQIYNVPMPLIERLHDGYKENQFSNWGFNIGRWNNEFCTIFRLFRTLPDTEESQQSFVTNGIVYLQGVFEGYVLEDLEPVYASIILPDKEDFNKFRSIDMTETAKAAKVGLGVLRSLKAEDFGTL